MHAIFWTAISVSSIVIGLLGCWFFPNSIASHSSDYHMNSILPFHCNRKQAIIDYLSLVIPCRLSLIHLWIPYTSWWRMKHFVNATLCNEPFTRLSGNVRNTVKLIIAVLYQAPSLHTPRHSYHKGNPTRNTTNHPRWHEALWPLLLTWINFNPSMEK